MYNKTDVLLQLNSDNYYIDRRTLNLFINNWKIDAVYEDENNEDYYDDFSLEKLKKGINLKAQGFSDEQIIHKLNINPNEEKTSLTPQTVQNTEVTTQPEQKQSLRNLTLDVSSQTLQMLAEAVAKKITDDIKNTDMAQQLIEAGGYKRDNEILSEQMKELIESNQKLTQRIEELESKKNIFERLLNLIKQG